MLHRFKVLALIALLPAALLGAEAVHAQGVGIALGANFNDLGDIDTSSGEATFDNASGWHLHLWLDMPFGPVALRPGLRYMDAGTLFSEGGLADLPDEDEVVSLLEIPVDLRIRLSLPLISPYVLAGPVFRFPTGDNEDRLKSFSFAGGLGVGVELGLAGARLFPELKYTFGLTSFTEEGYQIGNVTLNPDEDQRLNAVMLSLGIGL